MCSANSGYIVTQDTNLTLSCEHNPLIMLVANGHFYQQFGLFVTVQFTFTFNSQNIASEISEAYPNMSFTALKENTVIEELLEHRAEHKGSLSDVSSM